MLKFESFEEYISPSPQVLNQLSKDCKSQFYQYVDFAVGNIENEEEYKQFLGLIHEKINKLPENWEYSSCLSNCDKYSSNGSNTAFLLIQLSLYCMRMGCEGEFSALFQSPTLMYFDSFPLYFESYTKVVASKDKITFISDAGVVLSDFVYSKETGWFYESNKSFVVESVKIQMGDFWGSQSQEQECFQNKYTAKALTSIRSAFNYIKNNSLEVYEWVMPVLKTIALKKKVANRISSSSLMSKAGVINVTYPTEFSHLACLIIHECSHHYFYMTTRKASLINTDVIEELYSPFRGVYRPTLYVLLAFHAAVNIFHFISQIPPNEMTDYIQTENIDLSDQVEQMKGELLKSKALSKQGREMLEKLVEVFDEDRRSIQKRSNYC